MLFWIKNEDNEGLGTRVGVCIQASKYVCNSKEALIKMLSKHIV